VRIYSYGTLRGLDW